VHRITLFSLPLSPPTARKPNQIVVFVNPKRRHNGEHGVVSLLPKNFKGFAAVAFTQNNADPRNGGETFKTAMQRPILLKRRIPIDK